MLPLRISFWESYTLVRFSGQLGELYPIQTDASSTYVKMEVYLLLPLNNVCRSGYNSNKLYFGQQVQFDKTQRKKKITIDSHPLCFKRLKYSSANFK